MPPKKKSRYERASDVNDDELWQKMRKQEDMLYKALCSIKDDLLQVKSGMAQIQSDNNRHKVAQHMMLSHSQALGGLAQQTGKLFGKRTREDEDDEDDEDVADDADDVEDSEVPSPKRKETLTQDATKQRVSHQKKGYKSPRKATVKTSVLPPSRGRHDAVESLPFPFADDFHE